MKIKFLYISLFFTLFKIQAQKRIEVTSDSKYWMDYNAPLNKRLNLKDLKQTKKDFFFRLSYYGVKIDVWKDSLNKSNGVISNYTFRSINDKPKDTIIKKTILRQTEADSVIHLIQKSKILNLPTDREIKGWGFGKDGITYEIEYANQEKYTHKSYWSPNLQDSLKEALLVNSFIQNIEKILDLNNKLSQFRDDLPGGATYSNGSGMMMLKVADPFINVELNVNYRLPFGIGASYYQSKIKKKSVRIGIGIVLNHDFENSHAFEGQIFKDGLFKGKSYSGRLILDYKNRKLNYINQPSSFQNYTMQYALFYNKIAYFNIGFEHLKYDTTNKNGIILGVGKQIKFVDTNIYSRIWFYNNENFYNYELRLSKSFPTHLKLIPRIYTDLYYEKLFNYKGMNFSIAIPIKL